MSAGAVQIVGRVGLPVDFRPAKAVVVTPDDDNDLAEAPSILYIGVSGNVKVDLAKEGTVTYLSVPVGFLKVYVKRVYATGTTATNIISHGK